MTRFGIGLLSAAILLVPAAPASGSEGGIVPTRAPVPPSAAFFARGLWCYADALEGSMDAYGRVPGVKELVVVRGPHAFTTWPDAERKRVADRMIAFGRAAVLGVPLEGGRSWSDMKQLVATTSDVWEPSTRPTVGE